IGRAGDFGRGPGGAFGRESASSARHTAARDESSDQQTHRWLRWSLRAARLLRAAGLLNARRPRAYHRRAGVVNEREFVAGRLGSFAPERRSPYDRAAARESRRTEDDDAQT